MKYKLYMGLMIILSILACSQSTEPSAPDDHTLNIDGVYHRSGLNNPELNCVSCHGQQLDGGSSGVSCYDCHGKKWP